MMSVPFLFSGDVLTVVIKGAAHSVPTSHPNFAAIRDALHDGDEDAIEELLEEPSSTYTSSPCDTTHGRVVVRDGQVFYNGEVLDNQGLVDRILLLQRQGLPFDGMAKFIERLYNNMSRRARNELLSFIDRNGLTIDSEGYLLAYKAVRSDYKDKYSGTIDNSPGRVVSMDRAKVDDDFRRHCSYGLHAGALQYVYWYGGGSDRIIIVRIDPADVVSVPSDCDCQKLRVCRYEVVSDYDGELEKVCYDSENLADNLYSDDYEDDDYDWEELCDEDDYFDDGDVTSCCCSHDSSCEYGTKPSGQRYYNRRDEKGRFTK